MTELRKQPTLTTTQYHLLIILYKFRYATIPQLTTYKQLKSNSLQRNLNLLVKQHYIARQYNSIYKIDRKPAIYYLAAKGLNILKQDDRFDERLLHTYYKNSSLNDTYKWHCVDTLAVYNTLKTSYLDTFEIFTRQEVAYFDTMPATKPDLYLCGQTEHFVILAHDMPLYLVRKQLAEYITHSEDEGWKRGAYPSLLFILDTEPHAKSFLKHATTSLESAGIGDDELSIGVTTIDKINDTPQTNDIWSFTGDSNVPRPLDEQLTD